MINPLTLSKEVVNHYITIATSAVELISIATKQGDLSTHVDDIASWRLFHKRGTVLYREAMNALGLTQILPASVLNMNRDEIERYLKQRLASNRAMKKHCSSKNQLRYAAN